MVSKKSLLLSILIQCLIHPFNMFLLDGGSFNNIDFEIIVLTWFLVGLNCSFQHISLDAIIDLTSSKANFIRSSNSSPYILFIIYLFIWCKIYLFTSWSNIVHVYERKGLIVSLSNYISPVIHLLNFIFNTTSSYKRYSAFH